MQQPAAAMQLFDDALAATPDDADFLSELLPNNITGLFHTMEAARCAGVKKKRPISAPAALPAHASASRMAIRARMLMVFSPHWARRAR